MAENRHQNNQPETKLRFVPFAAVGLSKQEGKNEPFRKKFFSRYPKYSAASISAALGVYSITKYLKWTDNIH